MELSQNELIDRFLNGELKGSELHSFQKRVEEDAIFAEEVRLQEIANTLIIAHSTTVLKQKMERYRPTIHNEPKGNKGIWILVAALITAGIVALMIGFNKKIQNKTSNEGEQAAIAVTTQPTELSEVESSSPASAPNQSINSRRTNVKQKIVKASSPEIQTNKSKDIAAIPSTISSSTIGSVEKAATPVTKEPCSHIVISAHTSAHETCKDSASGKIAISLSSVKGGTPPYTFSLDVAGDYTTRNEFDNLSKGRYVVSIKDAYGCFSSLPSIEVKSKNCIEFKEFIVNPAYDSWKFPIDAGANGKIKIMNKAGAIVYMKDFLNGFPSEWDGKTEGGEELPLDTYVYQILLNNGSEKQGYIHILR